eukprot:s252_g1.t4
MKGHTLHPELKQRKLRSAMARPDVCHLERLQHEPFWDHVPIIQRDWNIPPDCAPGAATLLGADGLDWAIDAMHLPSLMSYVQPLAYQYYADAVERTERIGWRFPSWRSRDPSLVESMTLSSGLHTVWHSFQEALKSAPHCGRRCAGAALIGEALQVLHDALVRPSERPPGAETLAAALRAAWPHLREERVPLLRIMLLLPEIASEAFAEDADACSWEPLRMLLSASKCQAAAKIALASAPVAQCLRTLRPLWELGVSCFEGYQPLFLSSQRRLTHVLCDEAVLGVPLLDSQVMMHIHGAAGFLQEDSAGQTWLRLEVLHFMSSLDGAVRLTVYGHLKKDRGYYAQALTLPIGLLLRWRCRLSDDDTAEDARLISFFGYDAIIYCDIPIKKEQVDLLEIRPELLATPGAWTPPPLRLCSAMRPKWRLTACTQPLHTFEKMEALAPNLLAEFLDYHFLLGIEHITVFDADGSVEESLRRYEAKNPGRGQIDYVSHWPLRFGAAHAPRGSENWRPLLFEVEAENHCLWRYRGRADWAVVLHSPDEFLHVVHDPGEGSLSRFLTRLEEHRSALSHVEVRQVLFGGAPQDAISMPGRFLYREEGSGAAETASHTIIANVDNFAQAGVHTARQSHNSQAPLRIVAADPQKVWASTPRLSKPSDHNIFRLQELRVNHYVNALDRERCGAKYCASFDDSALWAEAALRDKTTSNRPGSNLGLVWWTLVSVSSCALLTESLGAYCREEHISCPTCSDMRGSTVSRGSGEGRKAENKWCLLFGSGRNRCELSESSLQPVGGQLIRRLSRDLPESSLPCVALRTLQSKCLQKEVKIGGSYNERVEADRDLLQPSPLTSVLEHTEPCKTESQNMAPCSQGFPSAAA